MKPHLTIDLLKEEAARFAEIETVYDEPTLYGVTDGKAVGTYLEHKFTAYLINSYIYEAGNSASGIDFPGIRLRRDNWVSVRYAAVLNSATSSGTQQRTDRHGILGQKPTDFQVSL